MIMMLRSSHLGQVLLRDQMPPSVLFINLDDAHAPDDMPMAAARAVAMGRPAAAIVSCVSKSES